MSLAKGQTITRAAHLSKRGAVVFPERPYIVQWGIGDRVAVDYNSGNAYFGATVEGFQRGYQGNWNYVLRADSGELVTCLGVGVSDWMLHPPEMVGYEPRKHGWGGEDDDGAEESEPAEQLELWRGYELAAGGAG